MLPSLRQFRSCCLRHFCFSLGVAYCSCVWLHFTSPHQTFVSSFAIVIIGQQDRQGLQNIFFSKCQDGFFHQGFHVGFSASDPSYGIFYLLSWMTLELTRWQVHAGVDSYFPILVILVMFLQFKQFPETLALCGICRFFLFKSLHHHFPDGAKNSRVATDGFRWDLL